MVTTLRKVTCVICRGIFKVVEEPPSEIVAGRLGPYGRFELKGDAESVDYCQRICPWCKRGSPGESDEDRILENGENEDDRL